jgi:hypothetical protein
MRGAVSRTCLDCHRDYSGVSRGIMALEEQHSIAP